MEIHRQTLEEASTQVGGEVRMLLPGVQTILGFQLMAVFNQRFEQFSSVEQVLHFAAFLLVALTMGLMLTLRTAEEVRDMAQMPDVPLPKPDPQMLAIAEKIVDQQTGQFDPAEFVDRYEDALRDLIEEKKRGHIPRARPAANDDGKVIDLMAALRRSLKSSGGEGRLEQRPAAASRRREPAKRGPAPTPSWWERGMSIQLQLPGGLAAQCDLARSSRPAQCRD